MNLKKNTLVSEENDALKLNLGKLISVPDEENMDNLWIDLEEIYKTGRLSALDTKNINKNK